MNRSDYIAAIHEITQKNDKRPKLISDVLANDQGQRDQILKLTKENERLTARVAELEGGLHA